MILKAANLKLYIIKKLFALLLEECCASFFPQLQTNHVLMIWELQVK